MVARDLQAGTPARSRAGGGTRAGRQLEVVNRGRQNGWPNDCQIRIRSYSHYGLSANSLANTGTVSSYRKLPTVCKKYERKSEGAQEIEKVLFVTLAETIKLPDHSIGFRLDAAMLLDSHKQVAGASIVQEEKTLSKAPQGRGAELVSYRLALRYPILKVLAHLVKRQIRIEVCRLSGQGGNAGVRIGCKCRSVAKMAGDLSKKRFTFQDGCGAARHCIGRLRRGQKAHEGGEVFDVAENVERRVRCTDLIGIRIGAIRSDAEPPGAVSEGCGGAKKRMKAAKCSMSLRTSNGGFGVPI